MTIFDFLHAKKSTPFPLISWIGHGGLEHLNCDEYKESLSKTIALLKNKGIKKGDRVCLIGQTSLQWHLFDMAIMAIGAVTVPIFPTIGQHDFERAIKLLNPRLIISDQDLRLRQEIEILEMETSLYDTVDDTPEDNEGEREPLAPLVKITQELKGSDIACILMTSGTTGTPKLMEFRHEQLYMMLKSIQKRMARKLTSRNKSHAMLPLSHVLGRCDSFLHLILNTTTQFGSSLDNFANDLQITKPHYLITVPFTLSKMVARFKRELENTHFLKRFFFNILMDQCKAFIREEEPNKYQQALFLKAQKVFKKVLERAGLKNLKFIVVGGGRVNKDDFNFLEAMGISVLQGYGLTETLGPLTISDFDDHHFESVGTPFDNVTIAFAPDGEILIKSPYLFSGYFKSTQSHFTREGFYRSGDIGELTSEGHLKITDRKKDIIINAQGIHISPQKIESHFQGNSLIEKLVVLGDHRPYLCALVSTHKTKLSQLIDLGVVDPQITTEEIPHHQAIRDAIQQEINDVNQLLNEDEQIKKFSILPIQLDPESDFVTPSLKIKRTLLYNKYEEEINAMYH